ncbi:hypothetical protein SmJEL517_g04374 [Synchytrium microbalum]|uniref:Ethylmalonyl-CoA decarboxylase n=1 Tax=Synchytrium microbalum TaxID=1806994 RepID=A0A507C399_9FUNG|nr:uncharacterized protein SmJEL517_g04374 [Synchytrium microbalum]TPX32564.1 hypothetical protein SmJEL517_g04374 [Synchytrium microbalum]
MGTLARHIPTIRPVIRQHIHLHPRFGSSSSTQSDILSIRTSYRTQGHGQVILEKYTSPGIATIKLSNLKRRNALSPKMMSEFADVVDELERECTSSEAAHGGASTKNDGLGGVILMGEGNTLCSGFDLSHGQSFMTSTAGDDMARLMHNTLLRLRRLPILSCAAIEGFALGGGAELSTSCDFRVMSESASLRFVQILMGVTPGWGGGTRLTRIVGRSNALRLLLSTPALKAPEALTLGLADVASNDDQVYEECVRLLHSMMYEQGGKGGSRHPVEVLRAMKSVVNRADEGPDTEASYEYERRVFASLWGQEANMNAIKKGSKKKHA